VAAMRADALAAGPFTEVKRRGTYTPLCGGRVPIPRRRFEHAKGVMRDLPLGAGKVQNRSAAPIPGTLRNSPAIRGVLVLPPRKQYFLLCSYGRGGSASC